MSDYRITGPSNRILPGGMEFDLHRLPLRVTGLALIAMGAVGWLSLLTWSIGDPSINRATNGTANNLLGSAGASLADMLFQTVGLAAIALFLPPVVWGVTMARGDYVSRLRHRLAMWTLAMVFLASTLSMIPKPEGWMLAHGLGGVIGDGGRAFFFRIGGFMEPNFAALLGGGIAGFLGIWTLMRACDVTAADLRLLWQLSRGDGRAAGAGGLGLASLFEWSRNIRHKIVAQAGGSTMPPARKAANPREYWLAEDPDRFAPPRRRAESAFDARFSGHDDESDRQMLPRARRRMAPAQPAASKAARPGPADLPDGRVEPYFSTPRPAPQPEQRVAVAPFAPEEHAPQQAVRQAPPPPRDDHVEPRPAYDVPSANGRLHDPLAFEEDEDEDDGFDEPPFEMPVSEPARPRPEIRREHRSREAQHCNPLPSREQRTHRDVAGVFPGQTNEAEFILPQLKLLNPAPPRHNNPELSDVALGRRAEMLQGVLEDFGVKGSITNVHPGPVITLYELEPARGTKSSRVIGLADDIARSMSAVSARVAVIPGRDAIGIELPNENREVVYLRELLEAPDFKSGKARLALALGKTIGGDPVTVDLARMPHLLIAGTTGSGKSVAINTMILSLLFRLKPEECRFIMIDPKMLELSVYDGIPHLLTPVVTDPKKAITALKWTVAEMTDRYERMCKLGVRNVQGFNQKVTRAKQQGRPLTRTVQTGFDEDTGSAIYEREDVDCSPMPYIVVVIDEMADLMMVAGKEIEFAVQRLSQMARAAGIHLIMATQRPSVDVITGTIKANFPSRISFQVASKIDSRTILGEHGAEQLLGAGDMLTMAAGGRIMRAHGPFVSDEEVENIVTFLRAQGEPEYLEGIFDDDSPSEKESARSPDGPPRTGDDLYDQAVDVVLRERRATTSYLQRRLGVGYNRAASLIEQMENEGLISAPNRTGKRDILAGSEG